MISSIKCSQFRCLSFWQAEIEAVNIVLWGANGSGKTSVLEALSFLTPGRGLRGASLDQVLMKEAPSPSWRTAITLDEEAISLKTEYLETSSKRCHFIQNEPVSKLSLFQDFLRIHWLTPEMDRLFLDSSSDRRRFLDRMVYAFFPEHVNSLHRYDYFLKERLKLLKIKPDPLWLSHLEEKLSLEGYTITQRRLALIQKLNEFQNSLPHFFPAFESSLVQAPLENNPIIYCQNREQDRLKGMTHYGAHRTDWKMMYVEKKQEASFCSTGEQKILLMSAFFSFIQAYTQSCETLLLLLLDEVLSHFDVKRRTAIFEHLQSLKGIQTWMTGTDIEPFLPLKPYGQFIEMK